MTKPLLIVVDDDRLMGNLVFRVGESAGFDVRLTSGGRDFQALCENEKPACIVMDIVMPDIEGIELLTWLSDKGCTARVILMSGYGGKYLTMAEKLGFDAGLKVIGTLGKPFKIEDLESMLLSVLDSSSG